MSNNRIVTKRKPSHASAKKTFSQSDNPKYDPNFIDYEFCQIKKTCGSCEFVNDPYKESLTIKYNDDLATFKREGILSHAKALPPQASPKHLAYRGTAKLAVRPGPSAKEPILIGLFQANSHRVVDISRCPIHISSINKFIRALKKELIVSSIEPWDEQRKTGSLRYIVIRCSHLTQELLVTFISSDESIRSELREISKKLKEVHKIYGAHLNLHPEEGNNIFGEKTLKLMGGTKLRERICNLNFELSPKSFFQVNPWQAENIYRRIEQLAGSPIDLNQTAWDLYSGVGPISLVLARAGYRVLSIEENPDATEDALHHFKTNNLEANITCLTGRVEDLGSEIPSWASRPNLVIANPSRRGIAETTRAQIKKLFSAKKDMQFIYLSCDINTLCRDLNDLQSCGAKVRQLEAFDIFSQTKKLEWLAVVTI